VQSKQSVDQKRPLPLGALRQLPHFASRSYATVSVAHTHGDHWWWLSLNPCACRSADVSSTTSRTPATG